MARFVALVKGSPESESGALPKTEELEEMTRYNEELVKAGVMLAGEGLHPSSKGVRISYSASGSPTVTDGPFAEAKELVAGFWIIQARDLAEAVEWLKRAPFQDGEVEIRQIFEDEDFGDAFTPELREAEKRLREQAAQNR
ncbi:MAG TPA: YciI family protein [Actinomycetota bacterium]|nr:YciI family protein [Actinomycetota bacterium]